jgi:hypothetical protein
MPDIFPNCEHAALAVTTTALAVCAFALAYIAKTLKQWWTWRK